MKMRHLVAALACAGAISVLGMVAKPAAQDGNQQGSWTQKAPMPTARNEVSAAYLNGKVYVLGGSINRVSVPHVEEYDIATDKWTQRMPTLRGLDHMGIAVVNGKIITVGGFTASVHAYPQVDVYEYDPAANSWRPLAPMKAPRASVGVAVVDGKVHAIGGRDPMGKTLTTHEVYDPATNKWTDATPLPTPRDHMATVAVDGKIHVIGGRVTESCRAGRPPRRVRSGKQFLEFGTAASDATQRRVLDFLQGPDLGARRRVPAAESYIQ